MGRDLDTESAAHTQGDIVRPFVLVDLDYPEGMVRLSSLGFTIELDGNEYTGAGRLGQVSAVEEGADAQSYGVALSLTGVPGSFSAYLTQQDVQGREATLRLGFLNRKHQIIGTPTVIFVGRMDTQDVSAGKSAAVLVAVESLLIDWERSCSRRYTDADQRARFPDDRGFELIAATINAEFTWGR